MNVLQNLKNITGSNKEFLDTEINQWITKILH